MIQHKLFFLLLVSFGFKNLKASECDTLLEWSSDYRIEWSDFQGAPNPIMVDDSIKAVTSTELLYSLSLRGEAVTYSVKCFMDRSKSWTVQKDSNLLVHERVHFDIAELYKRKIEHAFDSLSIAEVSDFRNTHQ